MSSQLTRRELLALLAAGAMPVAGGATGHGRPVAMRRLIANENRDENYELLVELCDTMENASLCAMGGMTPYPVQSVLKYFPEDFAASEGVGK